MSRKTEEAERPAPVPAPEATLKSAREPNFRERLLTPREAAALLCVSSSWLAKARMRGDGPLYTKVGRSVRYTEAAILQWIRSRQRFSTSER